MHAPSDTNPDEGEWGWLEGPTALRQLFEALHPEGMREGALLRSLRRHRLASVLSNVADRSAALPPRHPAAVLTSAGTAAVVAAAMAEADKAAAAAARGKPPPQVIPDVYRALITTHVPSPTAAAQIPSSRTISPAEISSRLARLASSISFADAIADARAASMPTAAHTTPTLDLPSIQEPPPNRPIKPGQETKLEQEAATTPQADVGIEEALADAAGDAAGEDVDNEAESEGQRPRPPPPMPSRVLEAARVVPPSEGVAEIARRATCGEVPLLPLCAVPSVQLLRLAILELEARLRLAGVAWTAAPAPVRAAWLEGITAAAHPVELAACLRVLDAHLHSSARSRAFGPERAGRWRVSILSAVTVGAVSEHLIVFNDACAWEMLERSANAASNAHSKGGGGRKSKGGASDAGTGAIIRPRMGVFEFAAASGEAMPAWLEFCEVRPRPSSWREPEPFPCSLRLDPYPQSLPETRHARSRTRCAPPLEESS